MEKADHPCPALFPSTKQCVLVEGVYICKTCGWSIRAHSDPRATA